MSDYKIALKELFEAGVHYGHSRSRWNPKMKKYIYGVRNGIHIIDIQQSVPMLQDALKKLESIAANNGRILFVSTKANARNIVKENAEACGQYYVNHRWLGGMLTNWKTINQSIKRLADFEKKLSAPEGLTKKEILKTQREHDKLEQAIGGIRKMGGAPAALFVIDTVKENIAVLEANCLGIPVFGIVDSNADPEVISNPIPGNDDAIRSIKLYCNFARDAILNGLRKNAHTSGVDLGANENAITDPLTELLVEQNTNKGE